MLSASAREQVQVLNDDIIRIVKEDHARQHPEGSCWVCGKHGRTKKGLRMLSAGAENFTYVTPESIGLKNLILCMPHETGLTITMGSPMYNTYHQGFPQTYDELRTRFAYWLTKQLAKQAKAVAELEKEK